MTGARPLLQSARILLVAGLLLAPRPVDAAKKAPAGGPAGDKSPRRPFSDVIKDHERLEGLLTLYRGEDHLFADIPDRLVGKPLGLSATLIKALGDWSARGGGLDSQVVSFVRLGDRLSMVKRNLDYRADFTSSLRSAVDATFPDSPVFFGRVVPVVEDRASALVDVRGLFTPALVEALPESTGFEANPDDAGIAAVSVNPDNVVVRIAYRYKRREGPSGPRAEAGRSRRPTSRLADPRYMEAVVEYNLFRLPENGFRPRIADERIGGFEGGHKDYTGVDGRDTTFRYHFVKFDLEPSNPGAALSPPREPIVFYVDRAVPVEWRGLVKEAARWWNRSFEKIGIQEAVRVLDQPEDSAWDPADLHHSMIYWNLSDNLMFSGMAGPDVVDPRTGQTLRATVYLNGEFPSYTLHRYLVYAWWRAPGWERLQDPFQIPATGESALASRMESLRELSAGRPRFCDRQASFSSQIAFARLVLQSRGELSRGTAEGERFAREAFAELVAHEVGHALGFSHNFKASLIASAADVAGGRVTGDPADHPLTASIMDYDPIYLAAPGRPQGDFFMKGVGPYDDLLVEYIYRPFPHLSPEAEAAELSRIARKAETTPGLMYDDGPMSDADPSSSTDDLGDDPLAFAESRLRMAQTEVLPRITELVVEEGHDFNRIRQALDAAIFSVAMDYIDIAARHVGAQTVRRIVADGNPRPAAAPVIPLDPARQRRALEVLDSLVFDPQAFPSSPELLSALKADFQFDWNYPYRYFTDYSFESRVAFLYDSALAALLEPWRLARVVDNERRYGKGASPLTLPELFGHLQRTAFAGFDRGGTARATEAAPAIPSRRRALQRLLTQRLAGLTLALPPGAPAEASQVARDSLQEIRTKIRKVTGNPARLAALDGYSRAHLADLDAAIGRALDARIELKTEP